MNKYNNHLATYLYTSIIFIFLQSFNAYYLLLRKNDVERHKSIVVNIQYIHSFIFISAT